MKKIIRLTESDLTRIVKRIIIESDKEKDNKSSNETKIPLQLKLKFQKFLKSAKGEEGEDAYLDRRRDSFIKELDGYSSMEVRTKLFKKLESEYGQVPGKFRAPFRWYK